MSANIDTMSYQNKNGVPWHGLGVASEWENRYSIESNMESSGLGAWSVIKQKTYTTIGGQFVEVPAQTLLRSDNNAILGVVGPRYTPLQNADMFNWFRPFLDEKLAYIDTAGSLAGGKKVWILAKVDTPSQEVVGGDKVELNLLLSNSNDGTNSVRVGFTPIRVVCANTLAAAHHNADSKLIRLRHGKSVKTNLDALRDTIDLAVGEFTATIEQYRKLAVRGVNSADMRKYIKILRGVENTEDKDLSTRESNIIDSIIVNTVKGKGAEYAPNTLWNLYNAYTEYLNWQYGRNTDSRMSNLWFGQGVASNEEALKLAIQMAG